MASVLPMLKSHIASPPECERRSIANGAALSMRRIDR
jgi:hypothetical protein